MPLIRNQNARSATSHAVALNMVDVRAEAESLIAAARVEVEALHASARLEIESERQRILEESRALGFTEGQEAGRASGLESGHAEALTQTVGPYAEIIEKLVPAWIEQFEKFGTERERLFEETRRDVLRFAVDIAARVVHRVVEFDGSVCIAQVHEALQIIGRPSQVRLSINPLDRDVISDALPGILENANLTMDLDLHEDEQVTRGGCIVSTPHGGVDATVETQVARIAEALVPGSGQ